MIDLVVDDYGLETVQEYMYHIRSNAEQSVRSLLKDVAKRAGTNVLSAVDYLDDGSPVSTILSHPQFSLILAYRSNCELRLTKLQVLPFLIFKERDVKSEAISTHQSR